MKRKEEETLTRKHTKNRVLLTLGKIKHYDSDNHEFSHAVGRVSTLSKASTFLVSKGI